MNIFFLHKSLSVLYILALLIELGPSLSFQRWPDRGNGHIGATFFYVYHQEGHVTSLPLTSEILVPKLKVPPKDQLMEEEIDGLELKNGTKLCNELPLLQTGFLKSLLDSHIS